jgi:hypothetical protein
VFGFDIGGPDSCENSPHWRARHMRIYWMGHGEDKKPVLRPVRGCIVNRKKITEIPTGYEDDSTTPNNEGES